MSETRKPSARAIAAAEKQALREKQLAQITGVIDALRNRAEGIAQKQEQHVLLDSVSKGLYEEIDKLTKKAPADSITDLILSQVNDVIKETKQLANDDSYVQRLKEFVPAGDLPEHRDVVVVLRQIRQGLERFAASIEPTIQRINAEISEARLIRTAIRLFLEGDSLVSRNSLEKEHFSLYYLNDSRWLGDYPHKEFRWEKLDNTDIAAYFGVLLDGNGNES